MAETTEWVRVRDTNTDQILPNPVPRAFLDLFGYLKEVPSSRHNGEEESVTEPVQPGALAPGTTTVQEPKAPAPRGKATTPVTEK